MLDALRSQTWPSPVNAHRKLWRPVGKLQRIMDCAFPQDRKSSKDENAEEKEDEEEQEPEKDEQGKGQEEPIESCKDQEEKYLGRHRNRFPDC